MKKFSPIDKNATRETVNQYHNLKKVLSKGILFGHQDDLAYGFGWKYENGRGDIKDVTGDYPTVYGWELGLLYAFNTDKFYSREEFLQPLNQE